eukprot:108772-Hanusia_phi.AAC.2
MSGAEAAYEGGNARDSSLFGAMAVICKARIAKVMDVSKISDALERVWSSGLPYDERVDTVLGDDWEDYEARKIVWGCGQNFVCVCGEKIDKPDK